MAIRTILACLTTTGSVADVLGAAAALARRNDAHVIGMHVAEALRVYPGVAAHVAAPAIAAFDRSQMDLAAELRDRFQATMKREGFAGEWRLLRSESQTAGSRTVESARTADLVVAAQRRDDEGAPDPLVAQLIREAGRPVLVVPPGTGNAPVGTTVLVGWSATREAARAAHDAVALLTPDARAFVLSIAPHLSDDLADGTTNDLALALARHGAEAEVVHRERDGMSVAEVLLDEAFRRGADLIVSGAFGHSRAYDLVIGAATHELLEKTRLPILFAK